MGSTSGIGGEVVFVGPEVVLEIHQPGPGVQQEPSARPHPQPAGEADTLPRAEAVKEHPPPHGHGSLALFGQPCLQDLIPGPRKCPLQPEKPCVDFGEILIEVSAQKVVAGLPLMEPDVGCVLCHLASLLTIMGGNLLNVARLHTTSSKNRAPSAPFLPETKKSPPCRLTERGAIPYNKGREYTATCGLGPVLKYFYQETVTGPWWRFHLLIRIVTVHLKM